MNKKTFLYLLTAIVVGAVAVSAYYFMPGDKLQGFIGKKVYQNAEDVPPWCVKPKSKTEPELPAGGQTPAEPGAGGESSGSTPGNGNGGDGRGFGGMSSLGGESYSIDMGNPSYEDLTKNSATLPELERNRWSYIFEDDDDQSIIGGGTEGGDEPSEENTGSESGESGDGTIAPGGAGRGTGGAVTIPDVPEPEKPLEGYFQCGCDDDEVFVEQLGQTFVCPKPGEDTIKYNEPGKYSIEVGVTNVGACSCPEGTEIDWKKYSDNCDPVLAAYNDVCLDKPMSIKIFDQCADVEKWNYKDGNGVDGYKNTLKYTKDSFKAGYYECWNKDDCKGFLKDVQSGKLSKKDDGYFSKMLICVGKSYTEWEDWPSNSSN